MGKTSDASNHQTGKYRDPCHLLLREASEPTCRPLSCHFWCLQGPRAHKGTHQSMGLSQNETPMVFGLIGKPTSAAAPPKTTHPSGPSPLGPFHKQANGITWVPPNMAFASKVWPLQHVWCQLPLPTPLFLIGRFLPKDTLGVAAHVLPNRHPDSGCFPLGCQGPNCYSPPSHATMNMWGTPK